MHNEVRGCVEILPLSRWPNREKEQIKRSNENKSKTRKLSEAQANASD